MLAEAKASVQEIDPAGADEHIRSVQSGTVVLDVREPDEYEQGAIPGAVHIPRGMLELSVESRIPDKSARLLVYCAGGVRSALAAKTLRDLGYADVYSVIGGFNRWKDEGRDWSTPRSLTPEQRNRYQRHVLLSEVGVSVGIHPDLASLCRTVEGFIRDGYRKVKIKIKPGKDVEVIRELRRQFGDVPMMADANSAYTLADIDTLRRLDEFGLMMIEQPLGHDDIIDHASLQKALRTPICLDESIHHAEDARRAIAIGACRIINIKIARVGGLAPAKALHDVCLAAGVPVWCGGMLETGIGRAHNIAITTLPGFTLPGDTSGSHRYWAEDIIDPPVTMEPDGTILVPQSPGRGYEVVRARLDARTVRSEALRM
jgi:rhodanese-related sulfurtransferase